MRCNKCQTFNLSDIWNREIEFQPSFVALKASADAGCDLCLLIFTSVSLSTAVHDIEKLLQEHAAGREADPDTSVSVMGQLYNTDKGLAGRDRIHILVGKEVAQMHTATAELLVYADSRTPASRYLKSRPINRNPVQGIQDIRDWIRTCDEKHTCISNELPQLPTRVVDVSAVPKVVTTHGGRDRYIALSYCWGTSGKNILLTEATFRQFSTEGIDPSSMPKTIQDAITITRELGFKYVWIDALCIIQRQKDLEDFKVEALNMAEYYRNAYVTLSIACAADCSEGFLHDRAPQQVAPCEVEFSPYQDPGITEPVAPTTAYLSLPAKRTWGSNPLDTRAWTFQESELSHRLLSFGSTQFNFLCQKLCRYENGDWNARAQEAKDWVSMDCRPPSLSNVLSSARSKDDGIELDVFEQWSRFVGQYSKRDMTNPDDKFAALAGMAKSVRGVVKCKYMFGLWENNLIKGLLWRPLPSTVFNRIEKRRRPHRAPSWSWGSIDGWVHIQKNPEAEAFIQNPANWKVRILSHEGISDFLDPIREALTLPTAFELHLQGTLKKVQPILVKRKGSGTWHTHWLVDCSLPDNLSTQVEVESHCVGSGTYDVDSDDDMTELEVLRLTARHGLMLDRVEEGRYRRVGYFDVKNEAWFQDTDLRSLILI